MNAIIQRTGEAGIATIPSLCLRFHINRMSHSHEGRSTLHVYGAEGREGGVMGTIYNSEGIDEAKKSPYDFPSMFLRIWNVSVVWQRKQH